MKRRGCCRVEVHEDAALRTVPGLRAAGHRDVEPVPLWQAWHPSTEARQAS